ncbi:MAG: choice-of-anchor D domain-containing protein [Proteobacteria bacterium]|nr:choice-of-anchor D domain-containing protein [Pseudomonadota bacterium]
MASGVVVTAALGAFVLAKPITIPQLEVLTPTPAVVVIPTSPSTPMTLDETLANSGSDPVVVDTLDGAGCIDVTATPKAGSTIPGTVAANGGLLPLTIQCNPPGSPTLRKCRWTARDPMLGVLGHFTTLCEVATGSATISGSTITFPTGTVGVESAPIITSFASQDALTKISVYAEDNDDVFKISSPCPTKSDGCTDAAVAIMANVTTGLAVTCTPNKVGTITRNLRLVGDTGAHGTIAVTCSAGSASGSGSGLEAIPNAVATTTSPMVPVSTIIQIANPTATNISLTGFSVLPTGDWTGAFATCTNGSCALGAGQSTTFTVTYAPQATGSDAAVATITSSVGPLAIALTGDATAIAGQLAVSETDVVLSTPVGIPTSHALTLTNVGTGPLTITGHAMDPEPAWTSTWAACDSGCTLAPNATLTVDVSFAAATIVDAVPSHLQIMTDAGTTTVNLTGTALGATVDLFPGDTVPTILFGDLPVGVASTAVTFQLRNNGNLATPQLNLIAPAAYLVTPTPFTIDPHATASFTITCTPPTLGVHDASLQLMGPVTSTTPKPFAIALKCRGTDTQLIASPSPLQLGEIRVGATVSRQVTLSTVGQPLDLSARSLTGVNPQLALGAVDTLQITAGTPAHFDVVVTATADDDLADTLTVTARDTLAIAITGKIVTPKIDYPRLVDLGTYCIARAPASAPVAFQASGTGSITMATAPVLETGTAFALGYTTPPMTGYPYTVPAGESAIVGLRALGQSVVGDHGDRIVWTSDMPGQETTYTDVKARFVDVGAAITPQSITFGNVALKQRSATHRITIENCDAAAITLASAAINNAVFVDVSAAPLPAMLQPGETATIDVVFAPARAGVEIGVVTVEASSGTLHVDLGGMGIGASDASGPSTGFYACDCQTTDPVAGAPIVLALVVVARRRRRRTVAEVER